MQHYQGCCHCGAVRFRFQSEPIDRGLRCNCSICARKGALMSAETIPESRLQIAAQEGSLSLYQFGTEKAKHYFCNRCGIYPFHETLRRPGHFRVNLGCVEELDTLSLQADLFDGKHLS